MVSEVVYGSSARVCLPVLILLWVEYGLGAKDALKEGRLKELCVTVLILLWVEYGLGEFVDGLEVLYVTS